jgi:hypothetical protein
MMERYTYAALVDLLGEPVIATNIDEATPSGETTEMVPLERRYDPPIDGQRRVLAWLDDAAGVRIALGSWERDEYYVVK